MTHTEATKKKACCNCYHCIRTEKDGHIVCHCDVDNHLQGYNEVMGCKCELWEAEHIITEVWE